MATTGIAVGVTPGSRVDGFCNNIDILEASVQTYTLGAPLILNASGLMQEIATNATIAWGFALKAGQNSAANGTKFAKAFKIAPDARYEGTLSVASWAQSLVGSKVGFGPVSSTWVLQTAAGVLSVLPCIVRGVSSNWLPGDTNPLIIFSVLNAGVQGEV